MPTRNDGKARLAGQRSAALAFGVLALGAAPLYLALGRRWWFYLDEWGFLVSRSAGSASDLLRPYNQHWTTLPILAWRALWQVFGVRSYLPYQAMSVALHITVATLGRAVMRRAGVRPWTATAAAAAILLFGAGAQNILSAFQIAFTGALAFGFAQLLLSDHEGAWDRRDGLGLAAGVLGLMCSGVALTMIAVVGVATLMRRGLRVAALHTVPVAVIYVAWYLTYGRSGTKLTAPVRDTFDFARTGVSATFSALGHGRGVGAAIAVTLVAGLVLLWARSDARTRRSRVAMPAALMIGALVFFLTAAVGHKADGAVVVLPAESRYIYVAAALLLPAMAIAVDAIIDRSRALGTVGAVLLLVGVPGNLVKASDFAQSQARLVASSKSAIVSIARIPLAATIPGSLRPDPVGAPSVTLRWLRDAARSGHVPKASSPSRALLATDRLRLSLMELDTLSSGCPALTAPVTLQLTRGQRIDIGDGAVAVTELPSIAPPSPRAPAPAVSATVAFGNVLFRSSRQAHTLDLVVDRLRVRVSPFGDHQAQLCAPVPATSSRVSQ